MKRERFAALAMFALLVSCGAPASGDRSSPVSRPVALPPGTGVNSTIPVTTSSVQSDVPALSTRAGVTTLGSCAVEFSEATLADRSWAFDGTLAAVGTIADSQMGTVPSATFHVNYWFRGGSARQVTVQFEMGALSEFVPSVAEGTRLLVSGEPRWGGQPLDDPVAWGCGFTQPWSADAASSWANALALSMTPTGSLISHSSATFDVVLQVGSYHLGWGPDMSVSGPQIVLYGDGSLYAELFDGVQNGEPHWSRLQAKLSEDQIQTLLRPGEDLPIDPPMNTIAVDSFPIVIVSGSHRWDVNDPEDAPFASYLADLTGSVRAMATEPWVPDRWIVRPFQDPTCTVTNAPSNDTYYDAPVYPGARDQFPLGTIDCYSAP
jgi:hypothetical protein